MNFDSDKIVALVFTILLSFLSGLVTGLNIENKKPVEYINVISATAVQTETTTVAETETETEITTETLVETTTQAPHKTITVIATAYCPCEKCCGKYAKNRPTDENGKEIVLTASGARATAGRTIAVDPSFIPYGTKVVINGHTYIAQDRGGALKGNRIDIYFATHAEAVNFGRQKLTVTIL